MDSATSRRAGFLTCQNGRANLLIPSANMAWQELCTGGSHLRNDAIYFIVGRARQRLDLRRKQAERLIAQQKADGSFRYEGKYQRGHAAGEIA